MTPHTRHMRLAQLAPAEEMQREPEQFWTIPRALLLAAFAAIVVAHHIPWSDRL